MRLGWGWGGPAICLHKNTTVEVKSHSVIVLSTHIDLGTAVVHAYAKSGEHE